MNNRKLVTIHLLTVLLILLTTLVACKKKEEAGSLHSYAPAAAPAQAPAAAKSDDASSASGEAPRQQQKKRKVILSHAMSIEVKSFSASVETLTKLAEANGGYVFKSSRTSQDKNSFSGTLGIRVPSGKTSGVLAAIRGMGRVESENSTAEDITDSYVDMEARLKNAQASEVRLKEMYQRAGTVKDVLEVEKELTRVRGDIEAFMAKKRNWDILTEMVTIEVELHEPAAAMPNSHKFWRPITTAFGEALEGFSTSLHALIIFVGVVIPWLVVIVPAYYLLVRLLRKRRERKVINALKQTD